MERYAKLVLALQIHDAHQDRVRAVRDPVHWPGQSDLDDGLRGKRKPFFTESENQDAMCFILCRKLLVVAVLCIPSHTIAG
jgi:hypothetical protein